MAEMTFLQRIMHPFPEAAGESHPEVQQDGGNHPAAACRMPDLDKDEAADLNGTEGDCHAVFIGRSIPLLWCR